MSHRSRRAPPIECPLASLGHNHNLTADHHQYHHPLSSSPLNPNDYQMSMRKSPLINIGSNGLIQFSTLHETDDSIKSMEGVPPHLSSAINHRLNDTGDYVNVYRDPLECNLSSTGESDIASSYHPNKNVIQTNCELTSEHLFDIAHKRNDRLLMRRTDRTKTAMNSNYCATIDCGEPYMLEQKMRSMLLNEITVGDRHSTYPFAKTNRTNAIDSHSTETRLKQEKPTKFVQHPSSPSETSESDRYLIERTSQDSPMDLGINRSTYNYTKSHPRISTPSHSNSLVDGMTSRLGRFSPSFDQGYHTLNSPSLSATTSTGSQPIQNTRIRIKNENVFSKLSDDACLKIFSWLESRDVVSLSKVCRRFDELVWRPQLWKTIVLKGKYVVIFNLCH